MYVYVVYVHVHVYDNIIYICGHVGTCVLCVYVCWHCISFRFTTAFLSLLITGVILCSTLCIHVQYVYVYILRILWIYAAYRTCDILLIVAHSVNSYIAWRILQIVQIPYNLNIYMYIIYTLQMRHPYNCRRKKCVQILWFDGSSVLAAIPETRDTIVLLTHIYSLPPSLPPSLSPFPPSLLSITLCRLQHTQQW